MTDRIIADYRLRTGIDPERAAATIAGEQSSGTFLRLAGETAALTERAGARVEALEPLADDGQSPQPGAAAEQAFSTWRMTLSWPLETVGLSLPNLAATVAGNLFELREVAALKLLDLTLPQAFADHYPGPGFGIEGTRRIAQVDDRPLIGGIIKPSVGLTPLETAQAVRALCDGGIDFIKDDELQANGSLCPFEDRLNAVSNVLDAHEAKTGKRPLYAINLTGEVDEMLARHDLVVARGGNCVMVSLNSVGLAGFTALRRHASLPIHAHRNGWGYLGRSPDHGWAFPAWSKLWRLAGADHMHVNAIANKFWEPDDSVIASARSLLEPLWDDAPCTSMPVFSSGQTVRKVHETRTRLGSVDLIHCAGGGIAGHPDGIAAGVEAFRVAWAAAEVGETLDDAARKSTPLARAMEVF